jgi:hypothetical protein
MYIVSTMSSKALEQYGLKFIASLKCKLSERFNFLSRTVGLLALETKTQQKRKLILRLDDRAS